MKTEATEYVPGMYLLWRTGPDGLLLELIAQGSAEAVQAVARLFGLPQPEFRGKLENDRDSY